MKSQGIEFPNLINMFLMFDIIIPTSDLLLNNVSGNATVSRYTVWIVG